MFKVEQKYKNHNASLYAVEYSNKRNLLFTGGADRVVASWDLNKQENTPLTIKTDSAILNLKLLNNEQHLFIGLFNGNFHIINLETKTEEKFFPYHKQGVFGTAYLPSANLLFVGAGDGTLSVWNTLSFQLIKNYKLSEGKIRALEPIGHDVFIGTSEGQIFRIGKDDVGKAQLVYQHDSAVYCLSYHKQKDVLLIGDKQAYLSGVKIDSNSTFNKVISIPAHNWPIYQIEFINENEFATCSRDKIVKIWNATSLEPKQRLCFPEHKGHLNSINNLKYISTEERLVSVGDDKQIVVWKK